MIDDFGGTDENPTPIVKWAGGKTKLLDELLDRIPLHDGYLEPFAGGLALFFRLAPELAVIGDSNPDLISMYWQIAGNVEAVIGELEQHARRHSRDHYYRVRSEWNGGASPSEAWRAAAFLYLNKTCFNGLWRVNKAGQFNVPIGSGSPRICNPDALRAASVALSRAHIVVGDYRTTMQYARPGDLIYFDPPYDETFNGYTAEGVFDQRALAATAADLVARGCHVLVSNSDTPLIRDLYAGWKIDTVRTRRAINSDGEGRGEIVELIITNRGAN